MKKVVTIIGILLLFISCDVLKHSTKSKGETSGSESLELQTKRVGDTVHYKVPRITYRDTTIYTTNRQGTTIKTVYDQSGALSSIDCFASAIDEIRRENRDFLDSYKNKEKDKEEKFDSSFILYLVIGLVVVVAFALFLMYKSINKNSEAISRLLDQKH